MMKQKGITLIALVITIVVLLILAAVSITAITDEDKGVVSKAKDAAKKTGDAAIEEDDDIKEIMDYADEETKIVDYTVSKNEEANAWGTTVTFNFTFEPKEYTLAEKREIAAFLIDLTFDEFKTLFSAEDYTYEQAMEDMGGEEAFLDKTIRIMKQYISYKDVDKLEALGIDVVSVKTPYGTTRYTSSLQNLPVQCGFAKNGTYDFVIKSGGSKETKTIKIDNIRSYTAQAPHEVKVDLIRLSSSVSYDADGSGTYTTLNGGEVINTNNQIDFKYTDQFYIVNKNEEYYKYFSNDTMWSRWAINQNGYVFAWFAMAMNQNRPELAAIATPRQIMFYGSMSLSEEQLLHYQTVSFNDGDGEWLEYLAAIWTGKMDGETITEEQLLERFPQVALSDSVAYDDYSYISSINADTNLLVGIRMCFTVDTYVEVVVWDEEKKKKIRIRKKVKDLTYDDELLVWDFDKGEFTTAKPLWIMKPQVATSYNLLKFSDGSELKTINQHRIFNKEAGKFTYPMTDETPIGTTTFNAEGKEVQLVSKEVITVKEVEYMNVITNYHMNVFAGNILTSCRLSNIYDIKDMKYVKDDRELATKEEYANIPEEYFNGLRIAEQPKEINRGNDVQFDNSLEEYVQRLIKMKL